MSVPLRGGKGEQESTYRPKALHVIPMRRRYFVNISNAGETCTIGRCGMLHEGLEHLPTPITVRLVPCYSPQVEEAFNRFRSKEVVRISWMDIEIFPPIRILAGVE